MRCCYNCFEMMRNIICGNSPQILIILFCLLSTSLFAQEGLEEVYASSRNFDKIVKVGEAYFKQKHPTRTFHELSEGDHRDGEFVKFMRWRSFWENSLNPDGTLGDISAHWRSEAEKDETERRAVSPYLDATWTNLSYENYIVTQIGLGRTSSMAFHPTDPNTFYVGAVIGGVWKTTDGGQTYTAVGDELPYMAVSSLIVHKTLPFVLYAAISSPALGVYTSIDGGLTWRPSALSFDMADNEKIYWMEADPNNSNKVYVATSDGLYLTTDRFITVSKINNMSTFDVKINLGNSNIIYQCGTDGEFYRSSNGGSTFNLIQDFGTSRVYAAVTALDTSKVYARNKTILYKSDDGGLSFSSTDTLPENNSVLAFSPSDANTLLVGNFETHRSDNDGATFTQTCDWLGQGGLPLVHVDQRNIFHNPLESDYIYYCNDGGVYRYIISTDSFENLSDGLLITQFYDIAVSQTEMNVIGGGSQDNGNVYRDTAGVWDDYAGTGDGMNQEIDPTDASTRYWAYQNGALRKWVNGSNSNISPPGQNGNGAWQTPYRLDPNNPGHIIAAYDTVYESFNKGDSWEPISGTLGGKANEIAISKSNAERIYTSRGSQLFVKDTASDNWTAKTMPASISDIEVDPLDKDIVYISVPGFTDGSKVYKSVDAGTTWENISGALPNVSTGAIELYENVAGGIFVGTDAGVYYRDDNYLDWHEYGNIPHTRVEDIEIQYAQKLVRIGTYGRGVLEAPIIIADCMYGDPDADNDGVCDGYDACPELDNALLGTACDDGDPFTTGEVVSENCECEGGVSNLVHCAAAGSAGTGGDWIKRVRLNTLDNSSSQTGYSDFKSESTVLAQGGSYELKVDLNAAFALDSVYAWIDYNRNDTFDSSELIVMSAITSKQSVGTVAVPSVIDHLATTMRVRVLYSNSNTADPCGNYFGEVEDYTIDFTYCENQGSLATGSDFINRVQLNTINNSSAQSFYSDFTAIQTDLALGSSYPIEVQLNYAFDQDTVFVWIDYDQNGLFEASELTILSELAVGFNSACTGLVDIPTTAMQGKTIMRIRNSYGGIADPCDIATAGEAEEYTINLTYCAAAGSGGTGSDWINRVTLNTISNSSTQTGYSDFKNISTDLIRGATYPIEVRMNYAFDLDSIYVWIDYNKNNLFDSSEQIVMSTLVVGFNAISTGIVEVPGAAIQGETVMRVRAIYNDPNSAQSCGSFFGEVEDYTINLTYCAAEGSAGTGGDWIDQVTVKAIDNPSGQTGYSNFKNLNTTLLPGHAYNLDVSLNFSFAQDEVYAWIDYDQNGAFTTNESISMAAIDVNHDSQGAIMVPVDAPFGETTLRVRVIYADPNPADPCGSYFGEVEDYTIIVEDPCPPSRLVVGTPASDLYATSGILTSDALIQTPHVVIFSGALGVDLNTSFEVELGAEFEANSNGCP